MAEAYPIHKAKDIEILVESGCVQHPDMVDVDDILEGYLYARIIDHLEATEEAVYGDDAEELVTNALVDYYIDIMAEM
jgi:hypothetical protein